MVDPLINRIFFPTLLAGPPRSSKSPFGGRRDRVISSLLKPVFPFSLDHLPQCFFFEIHNIPYQLQGKWRLQEKGGTSEDFFLSCSALIRSNPWTEEFLPSAADGLWKQTFLFYPRENTSFVAGRSCMQLFLQDTFLQANHLNVLVLSGHSSSTQCYTCMLQ